MPHTGDAQAIREWFKNNPDKWVTSAELAVHFNLARWQVNNAIGGLIKANLVIRGETFSIGRAHFTPYRLRMETEKREEFKVARPTAKPEKQPAITFPILAECAPGMASEALRQFLPQKADDRIQYLNPSTAIIWNSQAQLENIRQMALSH